MSTAAIRPRIRRDPRLLVYNPTLFTDHVEAGGVTYHFEPHGYATCACAEHNVKGAEDNLGVHAGYDWPRDNKNVLLTTGIKKVAAGGEMTADVCAEMICSPAVRGGKFFVISEGTPAQRQAIEAEARSRWSAQYADEVEQGIQSWERECRELQLSQPGALPPRQPRHVQDWYKFRKGWQTNTVDRSEHVCLTCGHDAESKAALDAHILEDHPGIAADRGLGRPAAPIAPLAERAAKTNADDAARNAAAPPVEAEAPGAGPGAEVAGGEAGETEDPQDETETGEVVRARAQRTGVDLSVADIRALAQDDQEVIADVKKRIHALRELRAKNMREAGARRKAAASATAQS